MELKNYNKNFIKRNFYKKFNKYNSNIVLSERFINYLMLEGKKNVSEKIIFDIFKLFLNLTLKNVRYIFKFSFINSSTILSTYKIKNRKKFIIREIPFVLSPKKRISSAIKFNINFIKLKLKNSFLINFKNEIFKILNKNSDILLKKDEIHLSGLKNKAYAHFRWF